MTIFVEKGDTREIPRTGEFWIDRRTPLGNEFIIGRHGTRDEVIELFRKQLWTRLKPWGNKTLTTQTFCDDPGALPAITQFRQILEAARAGPVRLLCHCPPERCHGEVIKSALEWAEQQGLT